MFGLVRLDGETDWRPSHIDLIDAAIERGGWVRLAIELPPNTPKERIAEVGFGCMRDKNVEAGGECRLDAISKVFLLNADAQPEPSLFSLKAAGVTLQPGQRKTFPVSRQ